MAHDPVNHPKHYTSHPSGVECIQITEHMGFNLGNAVKYIWRADLKVDAIEDLQKAKWYIERELTKRGVALSEVPVEHPVGWIDWPGGDCPVSNATKVMVRLRDGAKSVAPASADGYRWSATISGGGGGGGGGGDIVAYRVVGAD
jgi:hypothetical protein